MNEFSKVLTVVTSSKDKDLHNKIENIITEFIKSSNIAQLKIKNLNPNKARDYFLLITRMLLIIKIFFEG